jgi:hypothetical protein
MTPAVIIAMLTCPKCDERFSQASDAAVPPECPLCAQPFDDLQYHLLRRAAYAVTRSFDSSTDTGGTDMNAKKIGTPRAAVPAVRATCALETGYDDGMPHLEGMLESTCAMDDCRIQARIVLNLPTGIEPALFLETDRLVGGAWGGKVLEGLPGDVASLDALIAMLTKLREAVKREAPALRAKAHEFDRYVDAHRELPAMALA